MKKRGFAVMDAEQRKRIAGMGGRAAQKLGRAHQFDSKEAVDAGRKGGLKVSQDRAHMSEIGKRGAEVKKLRAAQKQ